MKVALFFVLFVASVFAQTTLLVIDDFTVGANEHVVTVTLDSDLAEGSNPIRDSRTFTEEGCTGLLGCSRDMQITVFSGFAGRSFNSDIFTINGGYFDAEWAVANPKTSSSITQLQYDGVDGTSALDVTGLGGIDITFGGAATGLFISAVSDIDITYTIEFYDVSGGICELNIDLDATVGNYDYPDDTFFFFDLNEFSNGCDMTNLGAIEFFLPSQDAVDAIVRVVEIVGTVQSSPPSPPPPPPSSPPSPEPSVCMCHCPIFTCALIFDPDDDENNAYYFDDDDEGEIIGSNGTINYYDFETDSAGVMVQISTMIVVIVAALVL
jgi:hypothetical protein